MKTCGCILLIIFIASCGGGGGDGNKDGITTTPSPPAWSIDTQFVRDGGPGKDGIPSIDNPVYILAQEATEIGDLDLVIGTKINGIVRAYPHSILNWHEIVNVTSDSKYHVLSYCPLTGTSALWTVPDTYTNKTFGVSGLLYNSNLILYDRESDSNWPQMLAESANGQRIGDSIEENAVIETTWATWKRMYPETTVLSELTGFSRDYTDYPYGSYLSDNNLLFDVANDDSRLHKKTRVLAIDKTDINKVYELSKFSTGIQVINELSTTQPYVVIGSSEFNFAIAYSATVEDGTELTFTTITDSLPLIMEDNEGNQWDALGMAISGPRAGQKLTLMSNFIAFWFSWVAIHPNPEIHSF